MNEREWRHQGDPVSKHQVCFTAIARHTASDDCEAKQDEQRAAYLANSVSTASSTPWRPTVVVDMRIVQEGLCKMQAKERVKSSLDEFSRAHGGDNPIDPTPENLEKWLEQAYPRDADGVSIREQIDVTTASEKQWVQDLVDGKVCPLAAKAFDPPHKFVPAPWHERLKLQHREDVGVAAKSMPNGTAKAS